MEPQQVQTKEKSDNDSSDDMSGFSDLENELDTTKVYTTTDGTTEKIPTTATTQKEELESDDEMSGFSDLECELSTTESKVIAADDIEEEMKIQEDGGGDERSGLSGSHHDVKQEFDDGTIQDDEEDDMKLFNEFSGEPKVSATSEDSGEDEDLKALDDELLFSNSERNAEPITRNATQVSDIDDDLELQALEAELRHDSISLKPPPVQLGNNKRKRK